MGEQSVQPAKPMVEPTPNTAYRTLEGTGYEPRSPKRAMPIDVDHAGPRKTLFMGKLLPE